MHIVQIHHEKIPVRHYGGTERVIEALATELVKAGHRVTLMCYRGDYEIPGVDLIDFNTMSKDEADKNYFKHIPADADIIHYHVPAGQDDYEQLNTPYLCTLHGNEEDLSRLPKNTVCISRNHANRHQRKSFVYNGLMENQIPMTSSNLNEREYFSFLGKASLKRKGLHNAKEIAKALKTPLHVGGGKGLSLFGTKYLGNVDNDEKYKLLGNSKALLFPIEWEEPFGLVMIEAMFAGAPVFAFERGSVSEVLGLEGNGGMFLKGKTSQELIDQIKSYNFESIKPQAIREYATRHFSSKAMMEGYVEVYQKIINGEEV